MKESNIKTKHKTAVIYARTATSKKAEEDNSIDKQVSECAAYAAHKGYRIIAVFEDDAVSGNEISRPELTALFKFIKRQTLPPTVLLSDASRLARNITVYHQLQDVIHEFGSKIEYARKSLGKKYVSII